MRLLRTLLIIAFVTLAFVYAVKKIGYVHFLTPLAIEGIVPMKKRIFARGIKKFVNVEFEADNSQTVETAYVSLSIDGEDKCLLTRWTVQGREMCSGAFNAIRARNLCDLMNVLDNFKAELPNIADDADATTEQAAA